MKKLKKLGKLLTPLIIVGLSLTPLIASPKHSKSTKSHKSHKSHKTHKSDKLAKSLRQEIRKSKASKDPVKIAKRFLGRRYRFGASTRTTKVFDCSSFVKKVIKLSKGKNLPRTAASQYKVSKKVKKPRKGDLVFFKGTYKKGISHVGIYIGNNKFIHASSGAKKVTISSLKKSYYRKHLKGFARV